MDDYPEDVGLNSTEMAAYFDISVRTLYFYEELNLIKPPRIKNRRIYGVNEKMRMRMILRGRKLGFSLEEIISILKGNIINNDFDEILTLEQITEQIQFLERQHAQIVEMMQNIKIAYERAKLHAGAAN